MALPSVDRPPIFDLVTGQRHMHERSFDGVKKMRQQSMVSLRIFIAKMWMRKHHLVRSQLQFRRVDRVQHRRFFFELYQRSLRRGIPFADRRFRIVARRHQTNIALH